MDSGNWYFIGCTVQANGGYAGFYVFRRAPSQAEPGVKK
jgi:hypothetical protein